MHSITLKASTVLENKGGKLYKVQLGEKLIDCVRLMNKKRIGLLVVLDDGGKLAGVVSERDIMRLVESRDPDLWDKPVKDVMTPAEALYVVQKDTKLDAVMALMTEKRVRHLPVMDGHSLTGVISMGDVVKNLFDEAAFTTEQLKNYILGG
ncbi:MAG: CBS domain-containing protein [Syntrophales bacterium]|nr:CBS domain-containing protein [Syntrophales bacterium]MCK9527078.1 CBS domain-containing protein [Syntrophales bacterium]MDX9921797.1 CBS domain-containing protein [Syntrophales bacterium]